MRETPLRSLVLPEIFWSNNQVNNVLYSTSGQSAGKTHKDMRTYPSWLVDVPLRIGYYLAGFADGEGSFVVSLRRRKDHVRGWSISTTFNVSQKERHILAYYKRYMKCGRMQERDEGVYYFVVENKRAIWENVIPFFTKFPFLSSGKQTNFRIFKEIMEMLHRNEDKTPQGFRKIIELREKLNVGKGRTRKYTLRDYERENPQRLYARPHPLRKRGEDDIVRSHGRP